MLEGFVDNISHASCVHERQLLRAAGSAFGRASTARTHTSRQRARGNVHVCDEACHARWTAEQHDFGYCDAIGDVAVLTLRTAGVAKHDELC